MDRDEFMHAVCKLLADFNERLSGDPGPCFCGDSEIATLEHKHGTWRYPASHFNAIKDALNAYPTYKERK